MRTPLTVWILLSQASLSSADSLVLRSGERTEVAAIEIGEKAVRVTTSNGKTWLLPLDAVDLERTRAANPEPQAPAPLAPPPPPLVPAAPPRVPPPPPRPPPPRPVVETSVAPAPRPEQGVAPRPRSSPSPRVALFVNGAMSTNGLDFTESRSYELFHETATLETSYTESPAAGLELGAVVRLEGPLGFGASAELFDRSPTASFSSSVPHPFFYDRLRESSGGRADLTGRERALHFDPVYSFGLGSRVSLDVFAGASLFFVETDVVEDVQYEETFPFDELVQTGSTLRRFEQNPWGFNVGASTTFRVGGIVGVDFGVRYSRATVRVVPAEGREIVFDAGGLRLGAGVRVLIP